MDTIGTQIRTKREAARLTQARLAELAGVKQSAVSEIESGKRKFPRYETVQRILAAIDSAAQETAPVQEAA